MRKYSFYIEKDFLKPGKSTHIANEVYIIISANGSLVTRLPCD